MTGTYVGGYFLSSIIAETHNSVIYESYHAEKCAKLAVKLLKKSSNEQRCMNELTLNREVDYYYILTAIDIITDVPSQYHSALIMNLAVGGDLYSLLSDVTYLSEHAASQIIFAGLMALDYLHQNGICHRDVKPDNFFLMDYNENEFDVVLGDLGHAKRITRFKFTDYDVGNIYFNAPEILKEEPYDESVDIWSLGVTMYMVLSGYIPFSEDLNDAKKEIINAQYDFDDIRWSNISDSAKHLISSMLQPDPRNRISIEQALEHKWIKEYYIEYNKQSERYHKTSSYNLLFIDPNEDIEL